MTPHDSDRIEELLLDAGRRWRAGVASTGWLGSRVSARRPTVARRFVGAAIASSVVAAVAIAVVGSYALSNRGVAESPGTSGGATPAPTLHETASAPSTATSNPPSPGTGELEPIGVGDDIAATGYLVISGTSGARVCHEALALRMDTPAVCVGPSVALSELPAGADALTGMYVRVLGVWTGDGVRVDDIAQQESPSRGDRPAVPCDEPAGGWPGNGPIADMERAVGELQEYIARHSDRFAGLWAAAIPASAEAAIVVGTVVEARSVESELRDRFTGNLCVVEVEFSADELEEAASTIRAVDDGWDAQIRPALNRVVVTVPVLDEATIAALLPHKDLIAVRSMLAPR